MTRPHLVVALGVAATVLSACGAGHGGHGANSPVAAGAREIEVTAAGLSFTPDELHAAAGEDIAIVLSSEDGLHDFTIDDLDAHVAVGAGDTDRGGFRATEAGRYEFYCSVPGHRDGGMQGVLVVE